MKLIPNAVTVKVARQALVAQKNSPHLLFGAGVVGVAVSTVMACRATLKLEETLDEARNDLEMAHSIAAEPKYEYDEADRQQDVAIIYTRSAVQVAKLYAPSVVVGLTAVGALTWSHRILNERNAALMAAYAAVDGAFRRYRERVVEKFGEEEDRKLRYEMEEVEIEQANGKRKKELRVAPGADSMYARYFDEQNANWTPYAEENWAFLSSQQNYWNDILQARGHVFLNEVYRSLGLDHTQEGAVVGWIKGYGDSYIDFGLFRENKDVHDFVNGRSGSVLLDFNVDGVIYDKLDLVNKEELEWPR